jgi:Pyridoxamine 5'-phosphate oxidase
VLAPETIAFLESGCGVIVGTVGADGAPHVSRGWGITVTSTDPTEVRLLLDVDDTVAAAYLEQTGRIAVTGGDIHTLHSIQFKGDATPVEPATDDDRNRARRYGDEFFGNINAVDGTPRELLESLRARDYVASTVRVAEMYDQSPGPSAGRRLTEAEQ